MRKQANGSANKVGSDALKSSLFLLSGADKILRPSTFTVFQEFKSTTVQGNNEFILPPGFRTNLSLLASCFGSLMEKRKRRLVQFVLS